MGNRVLTKREVMELMHFKSLSGFYAFYQRTPDFPRSFTLGLRRVGWLKSEVDEYIAKKASERNCGGV